MFEFTDIPGPWVAVAKLLTDPRLNFIGQHRPLSPKDRYRVITFSDTAQELTRGWVAATPGNVQTTIGQIEQLRSQGSTNLYAGLSRALSSLDDDRATSIVLVTDGVTNTGVIDPKSFHELTSKYDVRFFGFLMGNNANWPLVRTICEASGGFYAGVSNSDDIVGQIMLAKSKILFECLHDADLRISGVKTFGSSEAALGKVYRGQQLVVFGRYEKGGTAKVRLAARLTGQDKTYETSFDFPDIDTANPEIERLWAMSRVESIEARQMIGEVAPSEAKTAIRDLGVEFQIVTDETAMVVLADSSFEGYGIERRNKARTTIEQQARTERAGNVVRDRRVDQQQPMFDRPAPTAGGEGGVHLTPSAARSWSASVPWSAWHADAELLVEPRETTSADSLGFLARPMVSGAATCGLAGIGPRDRRLGPHPGRGRDVRVRAQRCRVR